MAGQGRPAGRKATPAKTAPVKPVETEETVVSDELVETPEQKRIRELEEQLAQLTKAFQTQTALVSPTHYEDKEGDTVLLHFIEDGFTAQGVVWYRGQEVEVVVGDERWNESLDRKDKSWMSMTEEDQLERFDKVFFRRGPWPGKKSYRDGEFSDPKTAPPESELERADRLERERRRAAPRLPELTDEK